jgi:hypothetical protein
VNFTAACVGDVRQPCAIAARKIAPAPVRSSGEMRITSHAARVTAALYLIDRFDHASQILNPASLADVAA